MNTYRTYRTEVMTTFARHKGWQYFKEFSAKTKADAVKQARDYNWRYGCLDRRTDGRITFRAVEIA